MMVWLLFSIVLVVLLHKAWKSWNDPVWRDIPGPSYSIPFVGVLLDVLNNNTSVLHTRWQKQYGSVFRYYMFGATRVMVTDPEVVKYVLLNNHLFDKNMLSYRMLSEMLGNGLVTEQDETVHKLHRGIIAPCFNTLHIQSFIPIFQKKASLLVEDWESVADKGQPVEIRDYIAKATSDIIGAAAFGYQLNSQRNPSENSVYYIFKALVGDGVNFFEAIPIVKRFIKSNKDRMRAAHSLGKEIETIVAEKQNHSKDSTQRPDLLDIMLGAKNEKGDVLSREALADHTKTFLLAGYETTSVCILWTLYLLAKHPEIQEKLAAEIRDVIGSQNKPSAQDIEKMPYLFKVVRESLRYCPPVPFVSRNASEDTTLAGYKITKGTKIMINIYHQHHNSPVWDHPEVFDPERWSNDDESQANSLAGSYIPFILGSRNCIGNRFALLEVKVLLAMVVQHFNFTLIPGQKVPNTKANVTMMPRDPLYLYIHKR